MAEEKSPLDQALDIFVFAPIGLALTAQEELPKLVEKGRTRVSGQMMMAKMIGQFAVQQGQREAEKQVKKATERLADLGVRAPNVPSPSTTPSTPRAASPAPSPAPAEPTSTSTPSAAASPSPTTNGGGVPPVDQLAIPGYDALSAGQVVQRLAGLSADELEAVAKYETATRHRKTILTRVSQLQSAS